MSPTSYLCSLCKPFMIAVVFLLGFHGIGHSMDGVQFFEVDVSAREKIDSLLMMHDLCRQGVIYPDSAVYYSIQALDIASFTFGIESEEYTDIFTDYFLSDIASNRELLTTQVYTLLTQTFDCSTSYSWRSFYRLACLLDNFNDTDKASELYRVILNLSPSHKGRIMAGMALAKIQRRAEDLNLEEAYEKFKDDIDALQSPEREDVLIEIAIDLASYFLSIDNDAKALEYISLGERLTGHVSSHKMLGLLRVKYDYLLRRNHREVVECLDNAIEMVSREDAVQEDKDWIAAALLTRGDYAWNQLVNVDQACVHYVQAYNLLKGNSAYDNSVLGAIARRLIFLLTMSGDMNKAITLGELYIDQIGPKGISNQMLFLVLDLIEAYLKNGQVSEASQKFVRFKEDLMACQDTREKSLLMQAKINIAQGNYTDTALILEDLMESTRRPDIRMWTQRYLATVYSQLGDSRMEAMSDSINNFTKQWVGNQFWFISPSERRNWLELCRETIEYQLSLKGNGRAVRNAAEMSLFMKSLLFRTDSKIKDRIAGKFSETVSINNLDSLRLLRIEAINHGDGEIVRNVNQQIDSLRQQITYDFVERNLLQKDIDINLSTVCSNLERDAIAIDFIISGSDEAAELGAFAYAMDKNPKYVPIMPLRKILEVAEYEAIWERLDLEIRNYNKVYFCLDGILNILPIEYSRTVGKESGMANVELHRVFHLSMINNSPTIGNNVAFIGITDYGPPTKMLDNTMSWTPLESPMLELNSIRTKCHENLGTILLDDDASERNLLKLNGTPLTTLHISAHGIFRSHEALDSIVRGNASSEKAIASHWLSVSDEPFSGIILRNGGECSLTKKDAFISDGLLTPEEIETMWFPDLCLTVLSACESGLGEIDSDGVWGLQRAFRIAGAKSLICSLAKVDDYWTAQFMDAFYEQAAKGNNIYDSFQSAQRWLRREQPNNPEIWSAFILIE